MKVFPDRLETSAYLVLRDPRKVPFPGVTGRAQPMVPHAIAIVKCLTAWPHNYFHLL